MAKNNYKFLLLYNHKLSNLVIAQIWQATCIYFNKKARVPFVGPSPPHWGTSTNYQLGFSFTNEGFSLLQLMFPPIFLHKDTTFIPSWKLMASQVRTRETPNCKATIEDLQRGCHLTALVKQEEISSSVVGLLSGDERNSFASSLDKLVGFNKSCTKPKAAVIPVSVWIGSGVDGRCSLKRDRQDTASKEHQRKYR
jgi:hypothetical protein